MSWSDLEPERHRAIGWAWGSAALGLTTALLGMVLAWPVAQLYDPWLPTPRGFVTDPTHWPSGFNIHWLRGLAAFLPDVLVNPDRWAPVLAERFWTLSLENRTVFAQWWGRWSGTPWSLPAPEWMASCGLGLWAGGWAWRRCPFSLRYQSQGSARWATPEDLERDQLLCRTGLPLGIYMGDPSAPWHKLEPLLPSRIRDLMAKLRSGPSYVRNWEWLSSMLIAPPGTGKSVLLQTMLLMDWPDDAEIPGPSFLVNDPKGENYDITAAWRATLGPVFKLAWDSQSSHRYNFLSYKSLPGGARRLRLRRELLTALGGCYRNPTVAFNQVLRVMEKTTDWVGAVVGEPRRAGELLADAGAAERARELFREREADFFTSAQLYGELDLSVDGMAACLIPETVEQHWRVTGRAALTGFILYELYTAELVGREATFAALLEWVSGVTDDGFKDPVVTGSATDGNGEHRPGAIVGAPGVGTPQAPTGGEAKDDLTAELLDTAIEKAKLHGYPTRCVQELSDLRQKPDRERGSVISTAGSSIAVFKNAAVKRNTGTSDFGVDDIRGMMRTRRHPRGRPVTVYFVVELKNAEFLGRLTGLFFDQMAAHLMSERKEVLTKRRPVRLVADEFWTLPPLEQLEKIPAFGRGQWLALDLVGQSLAQVASKFGAQGQNKVRTIKGATSYILTPTQTDQETAKAVSESIGNRTVVQVSQSRTEGLGQGVNPLATNRNRSLQGIPLMRPDDVMSMEKLDPKKSKKGRMLVQLSGALNRPIWCRPPVWFWDPVMRRRGGESFVPRGLAVPPKPDDVRWGGPLYGPGYDPEHPRQPAGTPVAPGAGAAHASLP